MMEKQVVGLLSADLSYEDVAKEIHKLYRDSTQKIGEEYIAEIEKEITNFPRGEFDLQRKVDGVRGLLSRLKEIGG